MCIAYGDFSEVTEYSYSEYSSMYVVNTDCSGVTILTYIYIHISDCILRSKMAAEWLSIYILNFPKRVM